MSRTRTVILLTVLFCFALGSLVAQTAEAWWDAVGVRGGADFTDGHASRNGNFQGYELFVNYQLPWEWRTSPTVRLLTRVDGSAGALNRKGTQGFLATLGPGLALDLFSGMLEIDGGVSPTYLSKHNLPGRDLGGHFLFNLHAGVSVFFWQSYGIGYHYAHMSNAYIYANNPGINLHMLELKYRF